MNLELFRNKVIGIIGLGYVGKNLYEYLIKISSDYNTKILSFTKSNLSEIKNHTFDYFFNTAGNSGDFRYDIFGTIDSNLNLTKYLLENLNVAEKYVALSSTRIYGFTEEKDIFFDEDYLSVTNHKEIDFIYDGTKKILESIILNYSKKLEYQVSIARLSNLYGKLNVLNDATLIKKIIRYKIENRELFIEESKAFGKKDYIYIDDAVKGILQLALYGKNRNVYNIASGQSYSVKQISEILDLKLNIEEDNKKTTYSNISIQKAMSELNFSVQTDIEKGLRNTINFYNK